MEPKQQYSLSVQPDLAQASALMQRSWKRPCWCYTEEYLRLRLERITRKLPLAIGHMSETGDLVSFFAQMPYEVQCFGQRLNAAFPSFLTVAPEHQGHRLGSTLFDDIITDALNPDYDIFLCMAQTDNFSVDIIRKGFERRHLDLRILKVFGFLAGINSFIQSRLPLCPSDRTRPYELEDRQEALGLLARTGENTPLRKLIGEEDVGFLFQARPCSRTFVYQSAKKISALINVLLLDSLGVKTIERNVIFENVLLQQLSPAEQDEFLADVLYHLQDEGFHMAFLPDIGYVTTAPFRKFAFRLAPVRLNLYMSILKSEALSSQMREIDSFYLDVF